MEITRRDEENGIEEGYYKPNEKEQAILCEISDKIIDLIDGYKLTSTQTMFLLSALIDTHKESNGILNLEFNED